MLWPSKTESFIAIVFVLFCGYVVGRTLELSISYAKTHFAVEYKK